MFRTSDHRRIAVVVTLVDGRDVTGTLETGPSGTMQSALNREGGFLAVETHAGSVLHLSRTAILAVREPGLPCAAALPDIPDRTADARAVLQLDPSASPEAVRDAFLRRSWQYDAVLVAGERIAPEIRAYADAMRRRVGAAYAELTAGAASPRDVDREARALSPVP